MKMASAGDEFLMPLSWYVPGGNGEYRNYSICAICCGAKHLRLEDELGFEEEAEDRVACDEAMLYDLMRLSDLCRQAGRKLDGHVRVELIDFRYIPFHLGLLSTIDPLCIVFLNKRARRAVH